MSELTRIEHGRELEFSQEPKPDTSLPLEPLPNAEASTHPRGSVSPV